MKFHCSLPNYKRSFIDTERGLYYHGTRRGLIYNQNKCYEVESPFSSSLRLPHDNKIRYDIPILYDLISETKKNQKTLSGPKYIDADILMSMIEEDNNNSNDFEVDNDSDDNEDEQ